MMKSNGFGPAGRLPQHRAGLDQQVVEIQNAELLLPRRVAARDGAGIPGERADRRVVLAVARDGLNLADQFFQAVGNLGQAGAAEAQACRRP